MNVFFVSIPNESETKGNIRIRNGFEEIFLSELQSEIDDLSFIFTKSENGYGFKRPGLKTSVENNIFKTELETGFGELPKITVNTRFPRIRIN